MSIERAPTYDKAHYSWQAPSSQASQSIIEHSSGANQTTDGAAQADVDPRPELPRRSTFNYKQESEEHRKKVLEEEETNAAPEAEPESTDVRRGSVTSKPFKPSAKRTKSWDIRDLRGQLQMSGMREGNVEGPKDGFTEV